MGCDKSKGFRVSPARNAELETRNKPQEDKAKAGGLFASRERERAVGDGSVGEVAADGGAVFGADLLIA